MWEKKTDGKQRNLETVKNVFLAEMEHAAEKRGCAREARYRTHRKPRPTDQQIDWPTDWLNNWQTDWPTDWPTDWTTAGMTDWLTDW